MRSEFRTFGAAACPDFRTPDVVAASRRPDFRSESQRRSLSGTAVAFAPGNVMHAKQGGTHGTLQQTGRCRPPSISEGKRIRRRGRGRSSRPAGTGESRARPARGRISLQPAGQRHRPEAERAARRRLSRRRRAGRAAEARQARSRAAPGPTATSSASRPSARTRAFRSATTPTTTPSIAPATTRASTAEAGGQQIWGQATQNLPQYMLRVDDKGDIYAEGVDELLYGRLSNVL